MKKICVKIVGVILFVSSLAFGEWVSGYYRKDGTYVAGYWRTAKNSIEEDNLNYYERYKSPVKVRGYLEKDETYVNPYYRSRPNAYKFDNYSYKEGDELFNKSFSEPKKNYSQEWYIPVPEYEKDLYYKKEVSPIYNLFEDSSNDDNLFDNYKLDKSNLNDNLFDE